MEQPNNQDTEIKNNDISEQQNISKNIVVPLAQEPVIDIKESLYDENYEVAAKLYISGDYNAALKKAIELDVKSQNAQLVTLQGNCHFKLGNKEQALTKWKFAAEKFPSSAEAYINLGNYEYAKGKINEAINLWLYASTLKPENDVININLGCAFSKKNKRFESLKYFSKYLRYAKDETNPAYQEISSTINFLKETAIKHKEIAEEEVKLGHYNKAVQHYMFSIENYPMQVKAPFALGNIFYNDKNYEKALYYWEIARRSPQIPSSLYLNIAKAYDRLKKYDIAFCFYSRYLPIVAARAEEYSVVKARLIQLSTTFCKEAKVAEMHMLLAENFEKEGDYFKAIEEFENYMYLTNNFKSKELQAKVLNYKMFHTPESYLTGFLVSKIEELKDTAKPEIIVDMCNRIILLAEPNSREALYAQTKKKHFMK